MPGTGLRGQSSSPKSEARPKSMAKTTTKTIMRAMRRRNTRVPQPPLRRNWILSRMYQPPKKP